ncbi:Zinc carboxypeptidase A 1 [Pseudolycoriella hygida]|uniref:Zinc carboxypeptidase A 1 n=1 Tax=Pseudolycoriella hygida TaxID=35572 RepID=A0A9Q0NBD7_9DIPT|nr:Zinc carboxypeptidase A 1 [Pseudolycoriella hygida]
MKLQPVIVLLLAASCFAVKSRYDNYKLYSMQLQNEEQAKAVVELEQNTDSYDFWSALSLVRDVDVMVPPHKLAEFEDFLNRFNIQFHIKVENIQKLVDQQDPELTAHKNAEGTNAFDWTFFNTFAEINSWLDSRVAAYPNLLTNINIGTSLQGRQIRVIRYSSGPNHPAVFIEANFHAREWASSATATWIINELLTSTDQQLRALANTVDFYIVPVANPDGFVFSHESTRLWRKTRQSWGSCIGTDPNRNFDFFWMSAGASNNPCSDTYAGPNPFSEPETRAIRDFYGTIASRTRLFLSIHSFGQYLLFPLGHTTAQSNNHANLLSVGNAGAAAIRETAGADYLVGSSSVVLYATSGSTPDWAFGVHNTRLSYTFEVRPIRGSSNGFLLPPNQIIPNNREVLNGIVAMVAQARAIGQFE